MSWSAHGYAGIGCGDLIDTLSGRPAIVAGSARGVFEEVKAAQSSGSGFVVFGVNDVGVFLPHVDHMVSLHGGRMEYWAGLRRDDGGAGYGNKDCQVHDSGAYGWREWHQWTGFTPLQPLSGLFAAQIALVMGCSPIILCGCPMDATPRFWESAPRAAYAKEQKTLIAELQRNPELDAALYSMSGWTQRILGGIEDIAA